MFQPGSRYTNIETTSLEAGDGREIAYKRRRLLPRGASLPKLGEARVIQGDRLDLIAARTLGDPEQYWRVCDAADALDPADLVQPGRTLTIPMPQP
jgi:nucleoid-associated protein YgaU